MNTHTKTWDNLTVVWKEHFDVVHQGKLHRRFTKENNFRTWLCELNLSVGELRKGEQVPIKGKYSTVMHTDVEVFNQTPIIFVTRTLNYGEYTLGLISDENSLRTVHLMAPSTIGRITFNKRQSRELVG